MMHDFIRYGYIYGIGVRVWVHTSDRGNFGFGNHHLRSGGEVVEVVVVVEVVDRPESR